MGMTSPAATALLQIYCPYTVVDWHTLNVCHWLEQMAQYDTCCQRSLSCLQVLTSSLHYICILHNTTNICYICSFSACIAHKLLYTWISSSTYISSYLYISSFNHLWYTVGPDQVPDESSGAVAQTEVIPKEVTGMYIHTTMVEWG